MLDCQAETPEHNWQCTGIITTQTCANSSTTDHKVIHATPTALSSAHPCTTGNMLSLNVEHAKARQPFKLHSQHMHCRQKSQTANDSGLCIMTKQAEVAHYSTPVCQVYNA